MQNFQIWSLLQSKSVNNVWKLLQLLTDIVPQSPYRGFASKPDVTVELPSCGSRGLYPQNENSFRRSWDGSETWDGDQCIVLFVLETRRSCQLTALFLLPTSKSLKSYRGERKICVFHDQHYSQTLINVSCNYKLERQMTSLLLVNCGCIFITFHTKSLATNLLKAPNRRTFCLSNAMHGTGQT